MVRRSLDPCCLLLLLWPIFKKGGAWGKGAPRTQRRCKICISLIFWRRGSPQNTNSRRSQWENRIRVIYLHKADRRCPLPMNQPPLRSVARSHPLAVGLKASSATHQLRPPRYHIPSAGHQHGSAFRVMHRCWGLFLPSSTPLPSERVHVWAPPVRDPHDPRAPGAGRPVGLQEPAQKRHVPETSEGRQ
jgi:hypothetical protein